MNSYGAEQNLVAVKASYLSTVEASTCRKNAYTWPSHDLPPVSGSNNLRSVRPYRTAVLVLSGAQVQVVICPQRDFELVKIGAAK